MFWIPGVSTVRYKGSCSDGSLSITGSFNTLWGGGGGGGKEEKFYGKFPKKIPKLFKYVHFFSKQTTELT